jgi:putative methyltransferase (TIGR04325 family)
MVSISDWLPPAVKRALIGIGMAGNRFRYGYKSWEEARAKCSGYDSDLITDALVRASRRVRDGEMAYERDGVEFDSIQYSWPLLAAILGTPRNSRKLKVLDWGGSLGSTYRQNKGALSVAGIEVEWVVVEQGHLVEIGASEFSEDDLSFMRSTAGIPSGKFDVAVLASSICYVADPGKILEEIVSLDLKRIVFDRTPESRSDSDQIGIQKVGRGIYKASYPIRAFAGDSLAKFLAPNYELVFDWESDLQPDPKTISKGYCFDRI